MNPAGLRIAYVLPSLEIGGLEQLIVRLARALQKRGHSAAVFCTTERGRLADDLESHGISVTTTPFRSKAEVVLPIRLARQLRAFNANVVHTQTGSWMPGVVAARLVGIRGTCHTEHGLIAVNEPRKLIATKRVAFRLTQRTFVVSAPLKTALAAQLHAPESAIIQLDNGIDVERYQSQKSARATVRRSLGLSERQRAIGVVARLDRLKGVDVLLEALIHAKGQLGDSRVFLVGDGAERSVLEATVKAHDLPVTFLGMRSDVEQLLSAFDLVVQPSRAEGLPLAILEAMAAGRCVIGTAVGEVPAVLDHGNAGVIVPPEDPAQLAAAIVKHVAAPDECARFEQVALRRVSEHYGFAPMVNRYEEEYRAIAE